MEVLTGSHVGVEQGTPNNKMSPPPVYPPISTCHSVINRVQPQISQQYWPIRLPSDRRTFPAAPKVDRGISSLTPRFTKTEQIMRVNLCRRADARKYYGKPVPLYTDPRLVDRDVSNSSRTIFAVYQQLGRPANAPVCTEYPSRPIMLANT
jgi:hypothetical protein